MLYKPLARNTLVAVPRSNGMRIALVDDHELRCDRRPGIGRVVYKVQPCTVRDGVPDHWNRMFHTMNFPATKVTPVTAEQAEEMLRDGTAREWS